MLKASDLHERTIEDLHELEKTLAHDVFQNRFKNFTNRLDDTSLIKKAKRDLARVKTVLTQRVTAATTAKAAAVAAEPVKAPVAKAAKAAKPAKAKSAPKAAVETASGVDEKPAEKPAAAKKTAPKKTAKKSEAE
jgi:large subunit ribosomal protein L29